MTDQPTLRDRIRRVLAEADGFSYDCLEPHDYQRHADAILTLPEVLPAPVDRAAVLREAADECDQRATAIDALSSSDFDEEARAVRELAAIASKFRRMADGAQQPEEA